MKRVRERDYNALAHAQHTGLRAAARAKSQSLCAHIPVSGGKVKVSVCYRVLQVWLQPDCRHCEEEEEEGVLHKM